MLVKAFRIKTTAVCCASFALAVGVAGCGFELQGAGNLPGGMAKTYIDTGRRNTDFVDSLRDVLRQRGADVLESPEDAGAVLKITEDDSNQRVLSVTARNTPREYEIYYAVTVALEIDSHTLMQPQSIVVRRTYTYNETEVLGKAAEADELRAALADDLARQVMRRIEAATSRPAPST